MLVRFRLLCLAAFVSAVVAIPAPAQDITLDSDVISGLPIRAIGPAVTRSVLPTLPASPPGGPADNHEAAMAAMATFIADTATPRRNRVRGSVRRGRPSEARWARRCRGIGGKASS